MQMNILTIYDIQNKFIAYSGPIPEILDILSEWGSIFVLCTDGKVTILFSIFYKLDRAFDLYIF